MNDDSKYFSCPHLNEYLRFETNKFPEISSEHIEIMVDKIDACINPFTLKNTLITYRGFSLKKDDDFAQLLMNLSVPIRNDVFIPYTYQDNGFLSTSIDIEASIRYMNESIDNSIRVLCVVIASPGISGMPLSQKYGTASNSFDMEVLYKSRQSYTILSVTTKMTATNKYHFVIMKVGK